MQNFNSAYKECSNGIRQENYFEVESYEAEVTDWEQKRYFERIWKIKGEITYEISR